ncbi:hypothetical protein GYA19_05535 [Candidatus Beckwithbacteria bacterium]|nr:hypothetical protein [Candidatus Beckwithbacteria bacterium]
MLRPGSYSLALGGHTDNNIHEWFWGENLAYFSILEQWSEEYPKINLGIINIKNIAKRKES